MSFYLRNPTAVVISHRNHLIFFSPTTETTKLDLEEAELFCSLLQKTNRPVSRESLLALSSPETLELLVGEGILLEGSYEDLLQKLLPAPPQKKVCGRLVFGVSGAVSASAVHSFVLRALQVFCHEIDIVLTSSAERFLQPNTLLYPNVRVWSDAFTPRGEVSVPHIYLASVADVVLVLPASANTIAKLANGLCSDLLSLVVSATKAPVVVAPAMNGAMRTNPAIARNIEQLRGDGLYIIEPSFAWEMSKGLESELELGALGVDADELPRALEAILLAHQAS